MKLFFDFWVYGGFHVVAKIIRELKKYMINLRIPQSIYFVFIFFSYRFPTSRITRNVGNNFPPKSLIFFVSFFVQGTSKNRHCVCIFINKSLYIFFYRFGTSRTTRNVGHNFCRGQSGLCRGGLLRMSSIRFGIVSHRDSRQGQLSL